VLNEYREGGLLKLSDILLNDTSRSGGKTSGAPTTPQGSNAGAAKTRRAGGGLNRPNDKARNGLDEGSPLYLQAAKILANICKQVCLAVSWACNERPVIH